MLELKSDEKRSSLLECLEENRRAHYNQNTNIIGLSVLLGDFLHGSWGRVGNLIPVHLLEAPLFGDHNVICLLSPLIFNGICFLKVLQDKQHCPVLQLVTVLICFMSVLRICTFFKLSHSAYSSVF